MNRARSRRSPHRGAAFVVAALAAAPAFAAALDGTLVQFNDNGFWSWFQDERAIIDPATNQLLISSMANGSGAGGAARDGNDDVVSYNLNTGVTSRVTLADFATGDDHDSAALMIRPDGKYLAVYQGHQTDSLIRWRVSTNPGDISSWTPEQTLSITSNQGTTYANTFYLSGTGKTYDFFRGNNYDPHMLTSSDNGSTWSYTGHLLMDPGNSASLRPYVKYTSNGVDRVYFISTQSHPRESNTGIYVGYITPSDGTIHQVDGTSVGSLGTNTGTAVSVTALSAVFPANTVVNGTTRTNAWTTDLALDSGGNPYMAFTSRVAGSTSDHRFYYARWTGAGFNVHEIAKAGGFLYSSEDDYTGLAALSPSDPNTLYISTKIDPRDGVTTAAHYEIYRGFTTDVGSTWTWVPITAASASDNLRPIVPRWDATHTALLWFAGTYTSYVNANSAVVGKFYTGNNGVWTNAAGGTWGTAGSWQDQRIADGLSFIADFSTLDVAGAQTVSLGGGSRTLGFLTFGDANPATSGSWTLNNGSITLAGGVATPIINVKNESATIAAALSGTQVLTKTGAGTLALSGVNTYSGSTNVNEGALAVTSIASNTGSGSVINLGSVAGTGTLVYTGAGETSAKSIFLSAGAAPNGGTLDMSGSGLLRFTGATLAASPFQPHTLALQGSTSGVGEIDSAISDGSLTNKTGLLKQGAGKWVLAGANTYTGVTTIDAGLLQANASAYNNLLTNAGGVDLGDTDGALVLDYAGNADPAAAVRSILANNTGQIRSSTMTAGHAIGYVDDATASKVSVRVTLLGDANLDQSVDVADLGELATSYGATTGGTWAAGDFNYDNRVDVADLGMLATNYGQTSIAATGAFIHADVTTVPEPAMLALFAVAAVLLGRDRRR